MSCFRRPPRDRADGLHDEEGATMVLGAIVALVLLSLLALAVDLGARVLGDRDMQGAVDLAALDAVLALGDLSTGDPSARAQELAELSLDRNEGWASRDGRTVTTQVGVYDDATRTFTPTLSQPNAVLVTATAELERLTGLIPGDDTITHTAVADLLQVGSISIGTHAASIDSARAAGLSDLLSVLLAGPVTVDAVGWQGLADARVPLRGLMADLNVGSVEQLLDLEVTAEDVLRASASGLSSSGDPAEVEVASLLTSVAAWVGNQTTFRFGDLLAVEQGVPGSVATATVDAFSLVTGAAMIANDEHTVELVSDLSGVPGVTGGRVTLAVVEPPQVAVGRAGMAPDGSYRTVARTAQVRLAVDLELDPLGDYAGVDVGSLRLPLALDAGSGSAALLQVGCAQDEASAFARNLVRTTPAGLVYGATTPEALLTPSAAVAASIRGPLVDLTVDTALGGEVAVASVTAAGAHVVPGADEEVQLFGPFTARARIDGPAPFGGVLADGIGLSTLLGDLDLETTILESSPTVGLTVTVDGAGGTVSLTDDVLAPALVDAAAVVDDVDAALADLVDALGIVTIGDADTAVAGVDCEGRRLVQ